MSGRLTADVGKMHSMTGTHRAETRSGAAGARGTHDPEAGGFNSPLRYQCNYQE